MPVSIRGALPQFLAVLSVVLLGFTVPVHAQTDPATAQQQDEIEARFAEAYAALNAERLYTARKLLSELVTDYPTLLRARLELARAEYLARDLDAAEAQVVRVLDDPEVPASVRTTLLAFLAQIRDDQQTLADRHSWSGQIYGGLLYDSNVNFGVSRDVIDLGGAPINVAPELSDGAGVIDAGLGHTYNPNKTFRSGERTGFFLWQSQINGYYRGYFGNDEFTLPPASTITTEDFDLGVATVRTGPSWVVPGAWRFGIGLQADQIWLGGSKLAFITSINPNGTWQLNPLTSVSAGVTWSGRNFQQFSPDGRDGDLWRADASISRLVLERKVNLEAGVGYGVLDADDNRFSFRSPNVFVGATWQAWTRGQLYTRLGYRKFNYDGRELFGPPDDVARNEDEWRYTLGFRHQFARTFLEGWVLRGEWIYTNNDSNIELFEFDRNLLSIGLEKSF